MSLPLVIHVVVCVLGAFAGGAVIGWLVGVLKATTGAHEVIVTIMLNYVMAVLPVLDPRHPAHAAAGPDGPDQPAHRRQRPPAAVAGSHLRVNAGFLLALACAVGVWWLLSRSTIGFEFRTVGANPSAARSAGMSVPRTWILVMLIRAAWPAWPPRR